MSCLYILALDESPDNIPSAHYVTHRGVTKKVSDPLEVLLKHTEDISHMLIIAINRKDLGTVKHAREYLLSHITDDETRRALNELWIFVENISCSSPSCCTTRAIARVCAHIMRHENIRRVVVDLCHVTSTTTVFSLLRAFELLYGLAEVDVVLYLLEYHRREGHASIREVRLSKYRLDPIRYTELVLDTLLDCDELSASDTHSISLLKGRLRELERYLNLGAVEHVVKVLTELGSQIELTLKRLRDPDLKNIIERLPILSYVSSERTFIDKVRSVIQLLLDFKMYDKALKYLLTKILLIALAHCCYFGIVDREYCKFGNVEQVIRDSLLKFLRKLDIEILNRSLHYASTFDVLFIRKPFCRALCVDELEKAGEVECEGAFSEEELRETVLRLVDLVEKLPYYELCDVLKETLERETEQ